MTTHVCFSEHGHIGIPTFRQKTSGHININNWSRRHLVKKIEVNQYVELLNIVLLTVIELFIVGTN